MADTTVHVTRHVIGTLLAISLSDLAQERKPYKAENVTVYLETSSLIGSNMEIRDLCNVLRPMAEELIVGHPSPGLSQDTRPEVLLTTDARSGIQVASLAIFDRLLFRWGVNDQLPFCGACGAKRWKANNMEWIASGYRGRCSLCHVPAQGDDLHTCKSNGQICEACWLITPDLFPASVRAIRS